MTIEEAKTCSVDELLFYLKWQPKECYCLEECCWQYNDCEYRIFLDRIKEALEKQTPKKVKFVDSVFLGKPCKDPYCPSCDCNFNGGEWWYLNCCPDCGQKLDWSEE